MGVDGIVKNENELSQKRETVTEICGIPKSRETHPI